MEQGAPLNEVKYEICPVVYYELELFELGTSLHRAAEDGKLEVVKYLLDEGVAEQKTDLLLP